MGQRIDGRHNDSLRPLSIQVGYLTFAEGSALIKLGNTTVLCAVTVEDRQPPFLRGTSSLSRAESVGARMRSSV